MRTAVCGSRREFRVLPTAQRPDHREALQVGHRTPRASTGRRCARPVRQTNPSRALGYDGPLSTQLPHPCAMLIH